MLVLESDMIGKEALSWRQTLNIQAGRDIKGYYIIPEDSAPILEQLSVSLTQIANERTRQGRMSFELALQTLHLQSEINRALNKNESKG